MTCLRLFLLLIVAALAGCATQQQPKNPYAPTPKAYSAAETSRTIDLTHPPRDMWDRVRRGFAIPNLHTDLTDHWTNYYASHPEAVQRMSERAGKYLYYIVDELNRRGLPTELALLPFVESAYNPTALSRSKASGLWQFIPSTGRHFNLEQDWWRDERRDPVASTQAALDYLAYLYDFQGDWYLALASYNWGEGAVKRAMEKNAMAGNPTDYLSLSMPDETRNYVPKLQAIKNIIADPARYGIALPEVNNEPYFAVVEKNSDIDLELAAQLAEMPLDEFKLLNASFNRPIILAAHNPALLLPTDRVDIFNANLAAYKGRLSSWEVYKSKKGESYDAIAKRHGISVATLRNVNGISRKQSRALAQTLLIPATGSKSAPTGGIVLASLEQPDVAAPSRRKGDVKILRRQANVRTHTVRNGDTLYALAKRYKTSVTELRKLNNLKGNSISKGKQLRIPGTQIRG
ncbi:transglycosylase SLT domain-containing protein [Allopusillimonas ginsengisoli]|uniref:transglycosylase SLT domain-containing protein n=1 Tax=Allopusillimonas ginsengisoli TaxID=453575 RepID=UPI00101F0AE6|nr:transglycosylase SLT domain-containing protein [Allopusillimonas ginsengisoli]TEA79030.1 LysM peptidoglycan-binding domain-containing protein [Allopusillimonas ginsengisoli]